MPVSYEASVDYVTTTWPFPMAQTPLPEPGVIVAWARERASKHAATFWVKSWAWQGYVGWQVGPVCWGQKLDSTIVRCSGPAAQDWFKAGLPIGHNVSRIDLQCTVWGRQVIDDEIARHNEAALKYREGREGKPYAVRLVKSFGDGDTLYIGSRTSQLFVRLYNKQAESKGDDFYKGAMRFEVELKDETAKTVAHRISREKADAGAVLEYLGGFLSARGVLLPVGGSVLGTVLLFGNKERGDLETSLLWLEQQVSPTVKRLLREGYRTEVLQALGLLEYD